MGDMDYVMSADEGHVGTNDSGVPHHSLGNNSPETLEEDEEGEWEEVDVFQHQSTSDRFDERGGRSTPERDDEDVLGEDPDRAKRSQTPPKVKGKKVASSAPGTTSSLVGESQSDEVRVWFPVFPTSSGTLHFDFPGVA